MPSAAIFAPVLGGGFDGHVPEGGRRRILSVENTMYLKGRRGAIAVMIVVTLTALVAISAVSIDMSRILSLRHELQFSADAGAHAGAIQLMPPNDPSLTSDVAAEYSTRYRAMQHVVRVDSVELGAWDDLTRLFIPGLTPFNAVRVVVSQRPAGLMVSHLGVTSPRLRARAVGWVQGDSTTVRKVILAQ